MEPITTENVLRADYDEMSKYLFTLIRNHDKSLIIDRTLYVELMGEYSALYQYISEIYTFLIGKVRHFGELKDPFRKMQAMDKRDCLEQVLKCIKFQYDSLSRKATIITGDSDD